MVADISFISLDLVFPALARVAASQADLVLLVKPQFEVGRQGISGGIVTDPQLAIAAVVRVIGNAAKSGLECRGVALSPITGEHGNRGVRGALCVCVTRGACRSDRMGGAHSHTFLCRR